MRKLIFLISVFIAIGLIWLVTVGVTNSNKTILLNVSYDVIRDFYKEYNVLFRERYRAKHGQDIIISQSHGGASKQVLSVANGLPADVVTLTQSNDIETLVNRGLIEQNWLQILPNNAIPFGSVMVLLVKKGNPKHIYDWSDLVRDDVSVIFANPKTSANGRFAYLSALAYAKRNFDNEQQIQFFIRRLLQNVPVLEAGARGATISFTQRNLGDVLITPENEAALAAQALGHDSFEVIYPSYTAYTPVFVAEVNKNTAFKDMHQQAQDYLRYLWSDEAQELAAKNHFRPSNKNILEKYRAFFPQIDTFDVNEEFGDWPQINQQHFADNALFDRLYIEAQRVKE